MINLIEWGVEYIIVGLAIVLLGAVWLIYKPIEFVWRKI
jgi:hypothetical protein